MSSFLKKVLWIFLVVLICQISVKGIFASCDLIKLTNQGAGTMAVQTNRTVGQLETGESVCIWRQEEFRDVNTGVISKPPSGTNGTTIATCKNDGTWAISATTCFLNRSDSFCIEDTPIKATCHVPEKRCSFPDRAPGGTICRNGSIWKCSGYDGIYYLSETCDNGAKCVDLVGGDKPAQCVRSQCISKDGKRRNLGESICTGDYLNLCYRSGADENPQFTANTSETLCQFGCIESTQFSRCAPSLDAQKNACTKNGIKMFPGESACFDGVLQQCGKIKPGEFAITEDCNKEGKRCDTIDRKGNGKCVDVTEPKSQFTNANLLELQTESGRGNGFCTDAGPGSTEPKIDTALGCIPITPVGFTKWLLPPLLGITGGISFLLMVYGFILITFSQGDPKKIQGAKETITSAIIGLLLSVFAFTLLRLIIADILKIPGF